MVERTGWRSDNQAGDWLITNEMLHANYSLQFEGLSPTPQCQCLSLSLALCQTDWLAEWSPNEDDLIRQSC